MAKYSDFLTYCVFGFLATLVNMGTYHLLYDTVSLSNVAATVLAWFTAVTFAFLTNKFIVFKNRGMKVIQIMRELAMFYSARLFTGIIDVAFMFITVDLLTLVKVSVPMNMGESSLWGKSDKIFPCIKNSFLKRKFFYSLEKISPGKTRGKIIINSIISICYI